MDPKAYIGPGTIVGGFSYIGTEVAIRGLNTLVYGSILEGDCSVFDGAAVIDCNLKDSHVDSATATVKNCVLNKSSAQGYVVDSTLIGSIVQRHSKVERCNLKDCRIKAGAVVTDSRLVKVKMDAGSKIEGSSNTGELVVEGSIIQGSTLEGTLDVTGASVVNDAMVTGTWDISQSHVSGTVKGRGSIVKSRIESQTLVDGPFALFEVEVKDDAVIQSTKYCSVTESYIYGKASVQVGAGLSKSEIFGDSKVTISRTQDGLYIYGGEHSLQ